MCGKNVDGFSRSANVEYLARTTRNDGIITFFIYFEKPILITGFVDCVNLSAGSVISTSALDVEREAGGGIGDVVIARGLVVLNFKSLVVGAGFFFSENLETTRSHTFFNSTTNINGFIWVGFRDDLICAVFDGLFRFGLGLNDWLNGKRGVAEPVDEEEEEVAIAVGAAGDGAVAGGKGGGVGLVWRVAVERAGGEIFDINDGAAAGGVWIVADVVVAEGVVGPAAVEDSAEEVGGVVELVVKAVINFVARSGIRAAEAGGGAVLDGVRPRVGDESLLFF